MERKAGTQISQKAFVQASVILLVLMILAGVVTQTVPPGQYDRVLQDGRQILEAGSFRLVERPAYPAWRWFTAPAEVLWGPDQVTVITILVFILLVGAAVAVLDQCGILRHAVARIVARFGNRKYLLLLAVSLFFMLIGAFFGIFEEVVPLVPVMLALSYELGWDSFVGLGMSVLATNMGFSAAITNPFTIGVAQEIAGLPLFSGSWLRLLFFVAIYSVFALFLLQYAHKIERKPLAPSVHSEDRGGVTGFAALGLDATLEADPRLGRAVRWFGAIVTLILAVLFAGPLVPAISGLALPLVGLLFFVGSIGAGLLAGAGGKGVLKACAQGMAGLAPGIPLILMAASIKHIVASGGVMDTIVHAAATPFAQASPVLSALLVFALTLLIEFFVASGSAKAFLLMPILLPLADLVGVTHQTVVMAYTFGDGFSNMVYPTNPVLLICLGLATVSYPKWLKWSLKLWLVVLLVSAAFIALAVSIHFGPF